MSDLITILDDRGHVGLGLGTIASRSHNTFRRSLDPGGVDLIWLTHITVHGYV